MICGDCSEHNHAVCDTRNEQKQGKDCDCQHKVKKAL